MEHSSYIQSLLNNIVSSEEVDYDEPFGHIAKEYVVRLPNGSYCKGRICNTDVSEVENQSRVVESWKISLQIHRKSEAKRVERAAAEALV